jgi:hypothetical protein
MEPQVGGGLTLAATMQRGPGLPLPRRLYASPLLPCPTPLCSPVPALCVAAAVVQDTTDSPDFPNQDLTEALPHLLPLFNTPSPSGTSSPVGSLALSPPNRVHCQAPSEELLLPELLLASGDSFIDFAPELFPYLSAEVWGGGRAAAGPLSCPPAVCVVAAVPRSWLHVAAMGVCTHLAC